MSETRHAELLGTEMCRREARRTSMSDPRLVVHTSLPWMIFFGLFAVATTTHAQSNPRDQPRAPRVGTGTIRGRVVRADTGEPLRRVQIHIDEWSAKDQSG